MIRKRRRGYTLIETFAAMALVTATVTLLGLWLATVMRVQRAAGDHLFRTQVEERLARQFRDDVHAARSVLPLDGDINPDLCLRLKLPDCEVHYLRMKKHLERLELRENQAHRREQFQLPPAKVRFEASGGQSPLHVMLLPGESPLRIEAALGSDHRHERNAE